MHHLTTFSTRTIDGTAVAIRLLLIVVAAGALALGGRLIDARLEYLGAGYLVFTGVLGWFAPRISRSWLAYLAALIDVGAVTVLIALWPATPLPLWVLYVLPIIAAGLAGPFTSAWAALLALAGYFSLVWPVTGTIALTAMWPSLVLVAIAFAASGLFAGRLVEIQERLVWQEIAAARPLSGTDKPENVAAEVAERARHLTRADRAWVWWCQEDVENLRIAAKTGAQSGERQGPLPVTSAVLEKLSGGPVSLADLDRRWADRSGEMLALRVDRTEATVALLAVEWSNPPKDRALLRERLRVLVPWAAEAIARAQEHANMVEATRRERVLRQTAAELAAALDRKAVLQVIVGASRAGLNAAVALVEQPSGRMVVGDSQVSEALTRLAVSSEAASGRMGVSAVPRPRTDRSRVAQLEDSLALVAWRTDPPLGEVDAAWLEDLAGIARRALERCAAHDRLESEKQRLSTSLEFAPTPVAVWNADGELVLANAAFRIRELGKVPPRQAPASGVREEEIVFGDPPRIFVALTTKIGDGQLFLSLYHDVTRERDALRAKDELISMVGHELRNPLTSIQGYSQIMARHLKVVQEQVVRLNLLIGDFVEASKLEAGNLPLRRESVDMGELTRTAIERFRGARSERTVHTELAKVPPVGGDPVRLGQVLDNLLNNAAKYSAEGTVIYVTLGASEGRVVLSVRDEGIGIAPEHLPHLFDRFYRAPSNEAQSVKGFGLGLSIVRDIVAAHGGYVSAESAGVGKGSTFRVSLPALATETGTPPSQAA